MDQYADVQQSFGRCLRENGKFVTDFYRRLLASDERIPPMFSHTDWQKQNRLIRRGISSAITYAGSPITVKRQISEIAEIHSRQGRAPVDPGLYHHWVESLVQTVEQSDPRFSPALGDRWRQAVTPAIEIFQSAF